jgi:hypothetical protein
MEYQKQFYGEEFKKRVVKHLDMIQEKIMVLKKEKLLFKH